MSEVIPFPATARAGFVHRHARLMAQWRPDKAERHLNRQLQIQADAWQRKGVIPARAAAELLSLERAIRAELWLLSDPGIRA
jgi:hypothetical protein